MEKYGKKTKMEFYNPKYPAYLPGSPTYIGPNKTDLWIK